MDSRQGQAPRIFELPVHKFHTRALRLLIRIVKTPFEWLSGLRALDDIYARTWKMSRDVPFVDRVLQCVGVRVICTAEDLARIPKEGPVVVVANHPFGGVEGIILLSQLKRVRGDVKAMANYLLGVIPEMRDDFILVDPFATRESLKANLRPLKESLQWLRNGHLLIIFPAGEVSSFDRKALRVRDPQWGSSVGSLILKSGATVVPLYFPGKNTLFFQIAGMVHPRLRTILLPRQLANKKGGVITLRIGSPLDGKALQPWMADAAQLISYLRFRTYLLAERETRRVRRFFMFHPPMMPQEPVIPPVPSEDMAREIEVLPEENKLVAVGDMEVYVARASSIPRCLREIGRLREVTFRGVGEGTGNALDLDEFDECYSHLFMWNKSRREIVGSYRLGFVDEIVETKGVKGLYTRTLFRFDEGLIDSLPPAIEMGRSFIRTEYQKAYTSLFLLWKGISTLIVRNPRYRVLLGPVSITNEYREASRSMILASLRKTCMEEKLSTLVTPKFPPKPPRRAEWSMPENQLYLHDIEQMAKCVAEIEPDGKDIPVLLRQYLRLGGRLLAFNIDPAFSSVVDGLIMVDLTRSNQKTLRRYMGGDAAESYLRHHGVTEGTLPPG